MKESKPPVVMNKCAFQSGDIISYSITIKKIFSDNCYPCHQTPGSGGINLDNYSALKTAILSGNVMPTIVYNPGNIQMPPPPQKMLDSCHIKAINLWISQGTLNN